MPKGIWKPLTPDQENFLRDQFLKQSVKTLANKIGVSGGRVKRFLNKNNLVIPKELIAQRKKESQLKKGNTPFNKGMKQSDYMTSEVIERTKKTRFKKGNKPHNTRKDGAISFRKDKSGYTYANVRINEGVWKPLHRVLWENTNGSIPKDSVVIFKDGNTMNIEIENLELITRAENMLRNSKHKYPKETIPSMVLIKKLELKLKSIQNG